MAIHRHPPCPLAAHPPARPTFLADVLAGLRLPQKELPCKYFYDERGSVLFDEICELPEYYPTRTELAIMHEFAPEMAARLGRGCHVIEYGSGSSLKTPLLLRELKRPVVYTPVDVSGPHLFRAAKRLAERFPEVEVTPVAADFTQPFALPGHSQPTARRVVYFPGSTVGNFAPVAAKRLLASMRLLVEPDGAVLIGVDLKKDVDVLTRAYNDRAGVTAAFNLNLLARINRELGGDFQLDQFRHRATYNADFGRVEMHLISQAEQTVCLAGNVIPFTAGETIHTENSHKYTLGEFRDLAAQVGLAVRKVWTDPANLFSVQLLSSR